jgi:lipoate-protein ligase A
LSEPAGWRLIVDRQARGAWNMAVDEAILDRYAGPDAPRVPTLRLYGFVPAALSLGRLQQASSSHDPRFLRSQGIDLVRRPSGGNAVLHDRERTYSLVGSLRRPPFAGGVVETYREIAAVLVHALRRLGIDSEVGPGAPRESREQRRREPACFALLSSHEITHRQRKLVGSAQLRRRGAFLQHGSIPLRLELSRLEGALGSGVSRAALTDLETAAGTTIEPGRLDAAIVEAFEQQFRRAATPEPLSPTELEHATRLYAWKYCSTSWTYAGRLGSRELGYVSL